MSGIRLRKLLRTVQWSNWTQVLLAALPSVLLMLCFAITAGCANNRPAVYSCSKPPLKGETWADIGILSVEQAAAIDVCNIRNGVYEEEAE